MRFSIRIKLFLSHFLTIVLVSGSIGTYFYESAQDNLMRSLQSRLQNSAAMISRDYLVTELDCIISKEDMISDLYRKYSDKVRDVVATNQDIAFIYIMRKDGDNIRFVIDSDVKPAPPGTIYKEVVPELLEGFIRPSVDKQIYSDKWGYFLSGYSPLVDSHGTYLVGIDMRADEVKRKFLHLRMVGLFSLLLSMLLAVMLSYFMARHFTRKIESLILRCSEIADENLHKTIQPILSRTEDELDLLTYAFDRMAQNLEASRKQSLEAHAKVLEAKTDLEAKISERTHDLEQTNLDLRKEIARREQVEQILETTARTDYLTSLLNRRAMMQRLEQEVSRFKRKPEPFSLVMVDIDHFKNVNDTYGHPAGDQLLVKVANLLKSSIRDTDEIARWGGEEFLVLFPGTDLDKGLEQASRLHKTLAEWQFHLEDNITLSITASFGVCSFRDNIYLESLLKQVDSCLFQAKAEGRNRVFAL
ncbi:MAG: diguanylate cyclase [Deltaproteobacteria bacterium]|nr:diguanylate cyclase [Deltaproteobacteria bacterium]